MVQRKKGRLASFYIRLRSAWRADDEADRSRSIFKSKFGRSVENMVLITGFTFTHGFWISQIFRTSFNGLLALGFFTGAGIGSSATKIKRNIYGKPEFDINLLQPWEKEEYVLKQNAQRQENPQKLDETFGKQKNENT